MCVPDAERALSPTSFHPDVKCCSFVPSLPNFRVGALLTDPSPTWEHGRETVRERIRRGVGVTPLGIERPPDYNLLYTHSTGAFGKSRALRCPHFVEDSGACGIWPYREAVCATWHCKTVRGAVGKRFWAALRGLLQQIERAVAGVCLLALDPEPSMVAAVVGAQPEGGAPSRAIDAAALDGRADPDTHRRLWGRYAGREEEFYQACAEHAATLSWADVRRLAGPGLELARRDTLRAYEELTSEELPGAVRVGSYSVHATLGERVRISGYSGMQPLEVPRLLLELLPALAGRPLREALATVERDRGVRIRPALVRKLLDHEILRPAAGPDGGGLQLDAPPGAE
jgi:hypothetical protein